MTVKYFLSVSLQVLRSHIIALTRTTIDNVIKVKLEKCYSWKHNQEDSNTYQSGTPSSFSGLQVSFFKFVPSLFHSSETPLCYYANTLQSSVLFENIPWGQKKKAEYSTIISRLFTLKTSPSIYVVIGGGFFFR